MQVGLIRTDTEIVRLPQYPNNITCITLAKWLFAL